MEKLATKAQTKQMKRKTLVLITLLLCAVTALAQDDFKPKTVFLIRHAEKEDEPRQDPPLKKEGVARAQELARLLGGHGYQDNLHVAVRKNETDRGADRKQIGLDCDRD